MVPPDRFNSRTEDLVLVAVTSQITQAGPAVPVGRGDVEAGFLPKDSVARVAKLFTLHSSLAAKRICRLTPAKKDELPGLLLFELGRGYPDCGKHREQFVLGKVGVPGDDEA